MYDKTFVVAKRLLSTLLGSQLGQGTQVVAVQMADAADPSSKKVTRVALGSILCSKSRECWSSATKVRTTTPQSVERYRPMHAETKVTHLGTVRSNGVVEFGDLLVLTRFGPC